MTVTEASSMESAGAASLRIVLAGAESPLAQQLLGPAGVRPAATPDALALVNVRKGGTSTLLACGHDTRGLVYAVTELADLVRLSANPLAELRAVKTQAEQPANQIRSLTRLFCSDVEDKPWYNDREMWPRYFDMLVAQRFNRFNLAFGIGYDFIREVTDAYFLFTYPFLFKVPGFDVRVPQLPDAERDSNLAMLRYIGEQCVLRGLEFHVGLWMHGYVWINSPNPNYTIEGLDKTTHGPYCREAVRMLLKEVPTISGLTFRIHGESGVQEGSFEFWKTLFDGVKTSGRRISIDMHPKGMSEQMTQIALDTEQPIQMSPKFWAEHLGMPYHQADIRTLEKPKASDSGGLMSLSSGTRAFLRYGYGDLLPDDRKWTVVHRIWPGTQRVLLWGDPTFAAAYSRAFSFCGSNGAELMEMLSFKGRRGSGHAGNRCAYLDDSYKVRWDWQKFEYGTRVWGRMLYNPETSPEVPARLLVKEMGPAAPAVQTALANVSRILPIVLTAHAPSAGNNSYWPELYLNQSMVDAEHHGPYNDSPQPRVFANVSSLDPQVFTTIAEHADALLTGHGSGRYTPVEVAGWIERYAAAGRAALAHAGAPGRATDSAAFKRAELDIVVQAALGEFFAAKLRSGVLFAIFEKTKSKAALNASLVYYRAARKAWAEAAQRTTGVYMTDITIGEEPQLRGHWADRLPAMDQDIARLEALFPSASTQADAPATTAAIKSVTAPAVRQIPQARHAPPPRFTRGQALALELNVPQGVTAVRLHYRHVDQAENYRVLEMVATGGRYTAAIPADYTQTEFPLEYLFELTRAHGETTLYPGFAPALNTQPYFVVRSV
jgi:hypothetical protein